MNIFTEKRKREKWWESKTREEIFSICGAFTQVFGGENDSELEQIVKERFIVDGEISVDFMESVLSAVKSGDSFALLAEFKEGDE